MLGTSSKNCPIQRKMYQSIEFLYCGAQSNWINQIFSQYRCFLLGHQWSSDYFPKSYVASINDHSCDSWDNFNECTTVSSNSCISPINQIFNHTFTFQYSSNYSCYPTTINYLSFHHHGASLAHSTVNCVTNSANGRQETCFIGMASGMANSHSHLPAGVDLVSSAIIFAGCYKWEEAPRSHSNSG